jgi:hypothetical protein
MAKKFSGFVRREKSKKITTIGDGAYSRTSKNKNNTRKAYRGQGK